MSNLNFCAHGGSDQTLVSLRFVGTQPTTLVKPWSKRARLSKGSLGRRKYNSARGCFRVAQTALRVELFVLSTILARASRANIGMTRESRERGQRPVRAIQEKHFAVCATRKMMLNRILGSGSPPAPDHGATDPESVANVSLLGQT